MLARNFSERRVEESKKESEKEGEFRHDVGG
jgi:hypothetical protein